MTRKEYNGWTNYETWLVKLWIDNEEGSSRMWNEAAENCVKRHSDTSVLADMLKEEHEDALCSSSRDCRISDLEGFAADLMNAAFSEVNWFEIADSLLNDAKESLAA